MAATAQNLNHSFEMLTSLTLTILICFLVHGNAQSPVSYPYRACSSDNSTQNSTYLSDLNLLLSNLTANGPTRNRFFNASVGRPPNDAVYGLFQCRGDVTDRECRNCLAAATRDTPRLYCPLRKGAVIWYDECTLRYSNHSFFSTVSTEPSLQLLNTADIDLDKARFNQLVMSTLRDTAAKAATNSTVGLMFASQMANFTPNLTLYTLAQCTGDLSNSDCEDCLSQAIRIIPGCCSNKRGGRALLPSCYVRYELYMFYDIVDKAGFNNLVMTTLRVTADRAANASSTSKMLATQEAEFTSDITLYTLAECMSYFNNSGCKSCLTQAIDSIPSCCFDKQEDTVLFGGCYVRYGINAFYEDTATNSTPPTQTPMPNSTTPTPPLLPPTTTTTTGEGKLSTVIIVSIVVPITVSVLLFVACCLLLRRRPKTRKYSTPMAEDCVINEMPTVESLQYAFNTIDAATNSFSPDNKLGQGGFGAVYKGRLENGQEIAVKRLSKRSSQGAEEFKNEVMLLAKLQHRNLVRLLGFCLEAEEKILIYEYISNKSLDYFLFDPNRRTELNWLSRHNIIINIARGILYLHEDSRLRIIHRDLKASNILLDEDMNPKISDFGLARIIQVNQNQENYTDRIVGTFGYMSPEYAMHGNFSTKSDVYSFGVLTLEIICGKKNNNFYLSDLAEDILTYAWKLWKDGTSIGLLDSSVKNYSKTEVLRCIHIALLCVQDDPSHRPSMASIVLMLSSYSVPLSLPKEPTIFMHNRDNSNVIYSDQSVSKHLMLSTNEISVTELHPR